MTLARPGAPHVVLASCASYLAGLPSASAPAGADVVPVADDEGPLREALKRRGATVEERAWDDPTVAWDAATAVLLRTTWDYQERRDAFVAWADTVARRTAIFHTAAVVRWNTDKRYLRDLAERGAPVAPTIWLPRGAAPALASHLDALGATRAFLKPQVGANARETLRFAVDPAGIAAAEAHAARLLPHEGLLLQPYLDAVEREGELSLVYLDGAFSHGVRKVPRPGDYKVQEDYGALDHPWVPDPASRAVAEQVLALAEAHLGEPLLYARVDLLRGPDGAPLLNELEIVEPALFLRHAPEAGDRLAAALLARLGRAG